MKHAMDLDHVETHMLNIVSSFNNNQYFYKVSFLTHALCRPSFSFDALPLSQQYRCDSKILSFPNDYCYRGKIKTDISVGNRTPEVEYPMRFVDTQGEEEYEGKKHVLAIVVIVRYLELLHCKLKHTYFYY